PGLMKLKNTFEAQEEEFKSIIKIGRTHLQDATPLTLGQEISGWRYMLEKCEELIEESKRQLGNLAIGGTAVGTGINAHPEFGSRVANELSVQTGYKFVSSPNKLDRKSTRLNSSHVSISYAVFCLKKKNIT